MNIKSLLLMAALGLVMSALTAQAADTNFQLPSLSQKSVPTHTLTDHGLIIFEGLVHCVGIEPTTK